MLESWSNFFFGSFDPAGFVTVDKPPVAIWIQAASAKLLGFRGVSLLLPEALMGTASVLLTYRLVRRVFGAAAGLLAGLILAITPICVAVDRDNLPDPALVFVLLLAAWALSIAAETGRLKPLLLSAALVGVGFNIKMLAAFVVLPTFYLCYLVAAPINWRSRLVHLVAATMMVVAVSLSWSIAVELTPKSRRPYIGGSRNNSALDLALGYNGLGRVLGGSGNFRPGGPGRFPGAGASATKDAPAPAKENRKADDAAKPKNAGGVQTEGSIPIRPETPSTASRPVDVAKASPPTAPGEEPPPDGPGGGLPRGRIPRGRIPRGRARCWISWRRPGPRRIRGDTRALAVHRAAHGRADYLAVPDCHHRRSHRGGPCPSAQARHAGTARIAPVGRLARHPLDRLHLRPGNLPRVLHDDHGTSHGGAGRNRHCRSL